MNKEATYKIKNNDDWNILNEFELIVDVNNDAYFAFRAMERSALNIIYDPTLMDSLVRVGKESKKFPGTTHILILDIDTLGFESSQSEETFLKHSTRVIEDILKLNGEMVLDFNISCGELNSELIYNTLKKIYS